MTAVWIDDVSLLVQPILPKYWVSEYLTPYQNFVRELGITFKNDSRLDFVGMGTGQFGETRATDVVDRNATISNGLTSDLWITTVNTITDMYVTAFSQANTLRKTVMLQNAPFQFDPRERTEFSAYAAARKAGLSFNGLFYEWNNAVTYPYNYSPEWRLKSYDPMIEYSGTRADGL